MARKLMLLVGVILALIVLIPTAAAAGPIITDGRDDVLVFTGPIHIFEGETYGTVIGLDGRIVVDGEAENVIAFNGPVIVNGTVTQTVLSLSGTATVTDGGLVEGDVYARETPDVEPGAQVEGTTGRFDPVALLAPLEIFSRFAVWIAVSASTLALGLLLGIFGTKPADAASSIARADTPTVTGVGLGVFVGLPVIGVAITATGVGVPLGIGLLMALALIYGIAYVASAWLLGRTIVKDPERRVIAFIAGWAMLRAAALVPVVGGAAWLAAVVFGLGVLSVELWRARTSPGATAVKPSMTAA